MYDACSFQTVIYISDKRLNLRAMCLGHLYIESCRTAADMACTCVLAVPSSGQDVMALTGTVMPLRGCRVE